MSLGVVIKGPEGIVLAVDSRVTLEARRAGVPPLPFNFDNATKLLSFSDAPHNFVGAVTYGVAVIGRRTAHSFIPEFEQDVLMKSKERLTIQSYAEKMSSFFMARWEESMDRTYKGPGMTFIIGGYDPEAAYGKVFLFQVPQQPVPEQRNPGDSEFGMTWGGQLEIACRLIHGYDPALIPIVREALHLNDEQVELLTKQLGAKLAFPIPYDALPLQDCVDLAIFLIRSTMSAQHLAIALRGVGGPIEVAVITRTKPIEFIQKKKIRGEFR